MSTEKMQIFKCPVCDSVVEMLDPCGMELICCGPQMIQMPERVPAGPSDEHDLIVVRRGDEVKVTVGRPGHEMTGDHHIQWIEVILEDQCLRKFLRPGDPPEASFRADGKPQAVRCFCNMHGLWRVSLASPTARDDRRCLTGASA